MGMPLHIVFGLRCINFRLTPGEAAGEGVYMRCPHCGHADSRVLESRPVMESNSIRRRRACMSCDGRFTTYEKPEVTPLIVVKADGKREEFDRNKVLRGLITACSKRAVPLSVLENLADQVETTLRNQPEHEVTSRAIGELVMAGLKEIDEVAYVRFASVYRQFGDVQRFMDELQQLLRRQAGDQNNN